MIIRNRKGRPPEQQTTAVLQQPSFTGKVADAQPAGKAGQPATETEFRDRRRVALIGLASALVGLLAACVAGILKPEVLNAVCGLAGRNCLAPAGKTLPGAPEQAVGAGPTQTTEGDSPAPAVSVVDEITTPRDGAEVGQCTAIEGRLSPANRSRGAWLLLRSTAAGLQHLYVAASIAPSLDGRFRVPLLHIGGGEGAGTNYVLMIVRTNDELGQDFERRLIADTPSNDSTMLGRSLPDGAQELAQITLKRVSDSGCKSAPG